MQTLIVENVRCFKGRHEIPIGRLTLAVGENSSGKSTLLALVRFATQIAAGEVPDFNAPPFAWGAYDQIAHVHRGQGGRGRRFCIGLTMHQRTPPPDGASVTVLAEFGEADGQPRLSRWTATNRKLELEVLYETSPPRVSVTASSGGQRASGSLDRRDAGDGIAVRDAVRDALFTHPDVWRPTGLLESVWTLVTDLESERLATSAIAPARSRPERTYDPVLDASNAGEGSEVPQILARLARSGAAEWDTLRSALVEFGREAGLFHEIKFVAKGQKQSDPFQVHVKPGKHLFNIVDVGYGVSQALPVLVQALRSAPGSLLLLQQPEVHLHPRAQAAMGTFLTRLAARGRCLPVVETHSDYVVDRALMALRDRETGDLATEEFVLLFFERETDHATWSRIAVSESGELVDPPPGYRAFFLEEQARFLGVK